MRAQAWPRLPLYLRSRFLDVLSGLCMSLSPFKLPSQKAASFCPGNVPFLCKNQSFLAHSGI